MGSVSVAIPRWPGAKALQYFVWRPDNDKDFVPFWITLFIDVTVECGGGWLKAL